MIRSKTVLVHITRESVSLGRHPDLLDQETHTLIQITRSKNVLDKDKDKVILVHQIQMETASV